MPKRLQKNLRRCQRKPIERISIYYVYIILCKNGTYYTGYTHNLKRRVHQHTRGVGAKYLKGKGPLQLVYAKKYRYYKNALKAERAVKKLSHAQKKALIHTEPLIR